VWGRAGNPSASSPLLLSRQVVVARHVKGGQKEGGGGREELEIIPQRVDQV
jgi:hypothetical protein